MRKLAAGLPGAAGAGWSEDTTSGGVTVATVTQQPTPTLQDKDEHEVTTIAPARPTGNVQIL